MVVLGRRRIPQDGSDISIRQVVGTHCHRRTIDPERHTACVRHGACASDVLLVKVWVILDRPPNDPFLRKKEPFTSSYPSKACRPDVNRRPVRYMP